MSDENKKIKITKKRRLILDILEDSKEPITAEEVYRKIGRKNIDLSTVYRTLSFFYNEEIIEKSLIEENKVYYSVKNSTNHEHCLICKKCKKKFLFEFCPLKEMENSIKKNTGFEITGHLLEFEGICKDCQS